MGGPLFTKYTNPEEWVEGLKQLGYRAAYCPVDAGCTEAEAEGYARAAAKAGIVIAEVGAWCNPLDSDRAAAKKALEHCKLQLELAEKLGAGCCVNIAGSRGSQWDGPHPENLSRDTFDMIVDTVREIIDAVKPTRTFYTLEPMPWIYPDSPDTYLDLLWAVDRKRFAAHLDPVNMISSPGRYFDNAGFVRECFKKLGPYIKSVHAKDISLSGRLTVHLDEVRPGLGSFDYRTLLNEVEKLNPELPVMLEHLPSEEEYTLAAGYVRSVAAELGIDA